MTAPPAPVDSDPIVAGSAGGVNYLNIRQSRLEQLQRDARVNRSLQTLSNVAGGILGAIGYLTGRAASDDPNIQGAASDIGALGDSALQGAGTVRQMRAGRSTAPAEPSRSVATETPRRTPTPTAPPQLPAGGPGVVVRNKLSGPEYSFAKQIVGYRGGSFQGQSKSNQPGIDGYLDGVPVQLKQTASRSPTSVTSAAKVAGIKADNAGVSGVELFVDAPNVSQEALLAGPLGNVLRQQPNLSAITVFSKDGVVRFIK